MHRELRFHQFSNLQGDLEKATGLLEKELLDKEDTIGALRKQCADVKKLNLNMLTKVQVSLTILAIHSQIYCNLHRTAGEVEWVLFKPP